MTRKAWGLGLLLVGSVAATAGDLLPYHRRARVSCGVSPCYDYETRRLSLPDVRETTATLLLEQVTAPPNSILTANDPRRQLRMWQVVDRPLQLDHCSLTNIAVWIDESGRWSANMTAIQQPFVGLDRQATPAARFLRNKFHVKIHAYGLAKVQTADRTTAVGRPEIFCLCLNPFWVDREQIKLHSDGGSISEEQRQRLPLVDRLEVEFRYE
jgi:hypothetical protein